jgi:CBS domain-containing protein
MQARDIMTLNVISVRPDATLDEATKIMLDRRISGLPVVDDSGRLVGMVTEGDLLRRGELGTEHRRPRWLQFWLSPGKLADEYAHARGRRVEEVMSAHLITATEVTGLDKIVELMIQNGIRRVPIVAGDHLIGLISRADVMRALRQTFSSGERVAVRDDGEILKDIEQAFRQSECIPMPLIAVSVRNGEVDLRGCITDERERVAVRVAVENVPGVRAIHDHMIWVETMSGFALASPEDEAAERAQQTRELEKLAG